MLKITVITSDRNSSWASMQEIVPHLNEMWNSLNAPNLQVRVFNLDNCRFKELLSFAMQSDIVVMTIFTLPLLNFVKMLRGQLGVEFRFVFHLHGFATFACWPLYYWGLGELLTQNDIFIASSSADKKIMDNLFSNATTVVIPFSLQLSNKHSQLKMPPENIPFLYVGRLSEQKHIELALIAFAHALREGVKGHFHIYGEEDNLGSPHMGRRSVEGYFLFLQQLTQKLKITKQVTFYGFQPRKEIDQRWGRHKTILLIPSLHSDENFGMFAFRYLCYGHLAILSKWGGHIDLINNFTSQCFAVDVRNSAGPWIAVSDLLQGILKLSSQYNQMIDSQIPECYNFSSIKQKYNFITSLKLKKRPLKQPSILKQILTNLNNYQHHQKEINDNCQIFSGYDDPLTIPFFRGYGMS